MDYANCCQRLEDFQMLFAVKVKEGEKQTPNGALGQI